MNIKNDITISENEHIFKLIETLKPDKSIEAYVNQFKQELEKFFKSCTFEDSINIQNSSSIYFKGEIWNALMEKKIYENYNLLKNEMKSEELENSKENEIEAFTKVEKMLDEYLDILESMKMKALFYIKQFEKFIEFKKKPKINDPFLFLKQYIKIALFNIVSHGQIKDIYNTYLIFFYFCAEDASKYLKEIKSKYNEAKLIATFKNNLEKTKIFEIFNLRIKYEEHNNLKEEWGKLKAEENFVKGNNFLNEKIKEYVHENDENQFLNDLNNIDKLKSAKIDLSLPDLQNVLVKEYWIQNNIPWIIPVELKFIKKEQ